MIDQLLREKIGQVPALLEEAGIDLWLTFSRESAATPDPASDLIVGSGYTWQSAFLLGKKGERLAIVGSLEEPHFKTLGLYDEVIGYKDSVKEPLRAALERIKPRQIAINTSRDNVLADGLTHGMYELLLEYLQGTTYADKLVSSEPLVRRLRGRKSPEELRRIEKAVAATEEIIAAFGRQLRAGQTEKEAAAFLRRQMDRLGFPPAWSADHCPAVFTGPESAGAHSGPTERQIEPGQLMNIDLGVKVDGYCSDMQRSWYFLRPGERAAPAAVQNAFDILSGAIERGFRALKPAVESWTVDQAARSHIVSHGFGEYPHALGHEIGRQAHDGNILCPKWERYGQTPYHLVEEGQVYTIEPRIQVPQHGVMTVEDIAVVEKQGARWLSHPQRELWLVPA